MRLRYLLCALALLAGCSDSTATVTASDTAPDTAPAPDTVSDTAPDAVAGPLRIPRHQPPTTPAGTALDFAFTAEGGQPPYADWRVSLGALPGGVTLDADSGALTGAAAAEGFAWFVVAVTDAAGAEATELFGLRVGDPTAAGPLAARTTAYQDIHEERHLWNGLSYGLQRPDDPDGDYQLCTLGDTTFVSGQCTMATALRYAVEPSPEALAVLETQVRGWRDFQLATGVPGLVGRSFLHEDDPFETGHFDEHLLYPANNRRRGVNGYEDYFWVADASRDQFTGAVLGMAMAWEVLPEGELRDMAELFLVELADHVWDNDLKIVDPDGEMTAYGDLDGERWEGLPVPNGLNAVSLLAWFKIAHHVSGEDRFRQYYEELAFARDYVRIMREHQWVYMGYSTRWFNVYMSYENFFHLMRLEQDPALRQGIFEAFRDSLWLNTDDDSANRRGYMEHNPVKTGWYLGATGEHDPTALYHALWQVVVFPEAPLRDRRVENSANPDIEKNPLKPDEALYPLPANLRKPDMVIWHRSPYDLDGGEDTGEERTGCDYLLPYWLGRYYGWIDAAW